MSLPPPQKETRKGALEMIIICTFPLAILKSWHGKGKQSALEGLFYEKNS